MNSRAAGSKIKRTLDMLLSGAVLVVSSPLWLMIAILVKLDSTGPAFFVQDRVGKDWKLFRAYKFRTMVEGAADEGAGLLIEGQDDPRITRAGRFLRRWGLDELPQIVNILKGEMSIVGPRPTLPYQVEQYDEFQRRRLEVKPGITGWAQIHGRNVLSWPARIEYDVWYVDNWSFPLDMEIILRTLPVLLKNEGLYADEEKFIIGPQDRRSR
jgi:undecaprenyl phosphate N,N'-diacetylbacillosamine 1-phosphate transferase